MFVRMKHTSLNMPGLQVYFLSEVQNLSFIPVTFALSSLSRLPAGLGTVCIRLCMCVGGCV